MEEINSLLKNDKNKERSIKILKFNRTSEKYIGNMLKFNLPKLVIVLILVILIIISYIIALLTFTIAFPLSITFFIVGCLLQILTSIIILSSIWSFILFNIIKFLQKIESNERYSEFLKNPPKMFFDKKNKNKLNKILDKIK
jgi:uncharacterized membrane protein